MYADEPYHQLDKRGRPLVYLQRERFQIELEEDAGRGLAVLEHALVVCDRVLVGAHRVRARRDVRRRDDCEEVLVRRERFKGVS